MPYIKEITITVVYTGAPWDAPTPTQAKDQITQVIETYTGFEVKDIKVGPQE
jgi:hypothetical protein